MYVYKVYKIYLVLSTQKVYHVYKEVMFVKKTESITFRTDLETKNILNQLAGEKKWTLSQLSEEIIQQWLLEKNYKQPNNHQ